MVLKNVTNLKFNFPKMFLKQYRAKTHTKNAKTISEME